MKCDQRLHPARLPGVSPQLFREAGLGVKQGRKRHAAPTQRTWGLHYSFITESVILSCRQDDLQCKSLKFFLRPRPESFALSHWEHVSTLGLVTSLFQRTWLLELRLLNPDQPHASKTSQTRVRVFKPQWRN